MKITKNNPIYSLKFMFDWKSGVCLWSANEAANKKFGDYPIVVEKLPISEELKNELNGLIELYDTCLSSDNPGGNLIWTKEQIDVFINKSKKVYHNLCDELGDDYDIKYIEIF